MLMIAEKHCAGYNPEFWGVAFCDQNNSNVTFPRVPLLVTDLHLEQSSISLPCSMAFEKRNISFSLGKQSHNHIESTFAFEVYEGYITQTDRTPHILVAQWTNSRHLASNISLNGTTSLTAS